jgi:hypothetical protein
MKQSHKKKKKEKKKKKKKKIPFVWRGAGILDPFVLCF